MHNAAGSPNSAECSGIVSLEALGYCLMKRMSGRLFNLFVEPGCADNVAIFLTFHDHIFKLLVGVS